MPFKFGGPEMPMSLRWTRSLVYSEVVLLAFVVISYVIFTVLGLSTSANGTTSTAVSGSTIAALIAVFVVAILLTYLAVDLRHRRNSTRMTIAGVQVVMLVFGIITSVNSPLSIALVVLLTGGTLYSLYAPASNLAFAQAAAEGGAAKPSEPELPEELQKLFAEAKAKKAGEASSPEVPAADAPAADAPAADAEDAPTPEKD